MKKKQPQSQNDPRPGRGSCLLALLAEGSRPVLYGAALALLAVLLSTVYALSPNVKSALWKIVFLAPLAVVVAWILYVCSPFTGEKQPERPSSQGTIAGDDKRKVYRRWFVRSVIPASVVAAGLAWVLAEQHGFDAAHAAILFAVLLIASVQLIGVVERHGHFRRCDACGKSWALKRTGQRTKAQNPQEEWRCRHCGWTIWIDVVHGDMGGGHGGGTPY